MNRIRAGRRDVDIDAADRRDLGLAIFERGDFLAADRLRNRDQHLDAVADGEDRLVGLVEVPDHRLHALVDADIFGAAAAGDIDRVVVGGLGLREGPGQNVIVAELLGVGLVALEIVQRGPHDRAGLLVRADDMDGVTDRLHALFEYEDLVFLGEVADEHQNLLPRHEPFLPFVSRPPAADDCLSCH